MNSYVVHKFVRGGRKFRTGIRGSWECSALGRLKKIWYYFCEVFNLKKKKAIIIK